MFMELGQKLDNFLYDIKLWNTQRIWSKPYNYFTITKWIKNNKFSDGKHFNVFMDWTMHNKQLWKWQYEKLYKDYLNRK